MKSHQSLLDLLLSSTGVAIDSRTILPGQIFFALPGSRTDGNLFASLALEAGALLTVIDRESIWPTDDDRFWPVDDVLTVLQDLARDYRRHLDVPVMAITGSNGKTTSKNLLAAVLESKFRLHCTAGNFNNHIGLPLSILNAPSDTEFLLLEMGTNHFGEIRELCRIAEPDFGSILNVGKSHLEFLQSVQGVLQAKTELADFLFTHDGHLFVNLEEPSLQPLLDHPVDKITFEREQLPGAEYVIEVRHSVPDILLQARSISGEEQFNIHSSLWGDHNVQNLIHTLCIGSYFGLEMNEMASAISYYTPSNNRSQILSWKGHRVYLDAYNANPTSMAHAIRGFRSSHPDEGILILGEMGELGEFATQEHALILQLVTELGFDEVYLVGDQFNRIGKKKYPQFNYVSEVLELADNDWRGEEPILIKGSRFLALEKLIFNTEF